MWYQRTPPVQHLRWAASGSQDGIRSVGARLCGRCEHQHNSHLAALCPPSSQVCSPAWRSQWAELDRRCIASGTGIHAANGNKSSVDFSVEAVAVADGLLTFRIRSSSGGDAYTVRLWKPWAYVGFAHVRDNFDGTYDAWARVPEPGEYTLTVVRSWPNCSGLREDGLRKDSTLGLV